MIDPFELPFVDEPIDLLDPTDDSSPPMIGRATFLANPTSSIGELIAVRGAFLLVDKPYAKTSFAIVNGVRKKISVITGIKRVKVGHAGTLDPLATGLLILATRRGTKSIATMMGLDKVYLVRLRLGVTSPSQDLETPITVSGDPSAITQQQISEAVQKYEGETDQVPPIFSAIKQYGQPVYHRARAGKLVTLEARSVTMHSIEIVSSELPYVELRMRCSKGTYVRSLVRDLGEDLGVGAVMVDLRREAIGEWSVEDALGYEEALDLLQGQSEDLSIDQTK